tara:strand:+ start:165 stop:1874 length:1710 start_codon:yes stop_codon:yes gene_type:complete
MINFEKISYKNFLSSGNNFSTINLAKDARTLIVGKNGSGKSTLLDAITFGLFGKPFRKINKPLLVNTVNDGDCLVEIEFSVGTTEYVVKRGIKPNIFEVIQNGVSLDQTASAKDFQEYFERQILHLNYKSFTQAVILGSATFLPFMQLPAAHRREVIEDLLDIRIFSGMNVILKERIGQVKTGITDNERNAEVAKEKIEIHQKHLNKILDDREAVISAKEDEITNSQKSITNHQKIVNKNSTLIDSLSGKISSFGKFQKTKDKIEGLIEKILVKERKLTKEIDFYTNHDECPTCRQDIQLEFKSTVVKDKTNAIAEVTSGIETLNSKLEKVTTSLNEMNAIKTKISELETTSSNHTNETKTLEMYVTKIHQEIENLRSINEDLSQEKVDLELLEQKIKEYDLEKENLVTNNELYVVASSLLKDNGIKTLIIKQYIPVINKLINHYLASMDFFVNFTLDENFNETIKSRHRDNFSYYNFSEGEKKRIDLALLFTWRTIAKLKNSVNTNLLIMDEVFDSSLDSEGTEEFFKILYSVPEDLNIFIISHKDALQDKFTNTISVQKVKGFSKLT